MQTAADIFSWLTSSFQRRIFEQRVRSPPLRFHQTEICSLLLLGEFCEFGICRTSMGILRSISLDTRSRKLLLLCGQVMAYSLHILLATYPYFPSSIKILFASSHSNNCGLLLTIPTHRNASCKGFRFRSVGFGCLLSILVESCWQ
jgi:hypothetical protein